MKTKKKYIIQEHIYSWSKIRTGLNKKKLRNLFFLIALSQCLGIEYPGENIQLVLPVRRCGQGQGYPAEGCMRPGGVQHGNIRRNRPGLPGQLYFQRAEDCCFV